VILARQRQSMNENRSRQKRTYRRWTNEEIYTLEVAMNVFGVSNYDRLIETFQDRLPNLRRNENQVS
jgi:hypothetical protein